MSTSNQETSREYHSESEGHPLDAVIRQRSRIIAPPNPVIQRRMSTPESGEFPMDESPQSTANGAEMNADLEVSFELPIGVKVIADNEESSKRNTEVQRLLRAPRYFDPDFEEGGIRCYKCGGSGHMARDCTAASKPRSCFLCAQFGHDSRDCPNSLCWRCQQSGHIARDCPSKGNGKNMMDEAVCLRCGSASCPCAGEHDALRASGACIYKYSSRDMSHVRCFVCYQKGHLACGPVMSAPMPKSSCFNCGEGGHYGDECWKEKPQVMRGEEIHNSRRQEGVFKQRSSFRSSTYSRSRRGGEYSRSDTYSTDARRTYDKEHYKRKRSWSERG